MTKSAAFKAACLSAGLATAWSAAPAGASQYEVSVSGSTLTGFSQLTLMNGDLVITSPGGTPKNDGTSALTYAAGGFSGTLIINGSSSLLTQPWEMVGLTSDATDSEGLVLALASPPATGTSFSDFSGGASETAVISDVRRASQDAKDLLEFIASIQSSASISNGSTSSAIEFSNSQNIGTLTLTVTEVPEPSSFALVLLGLSRIIRRRRW